MALPPKGDPVRPLAMAVRSTRLIGIIWLLIGCASLTVFQFALRGGTGTMAISLVMLGMMVLFYILPGAGYLACSFFISRRSPVAVTVAIVLASLHGVVILLGVVSGLASMNFILLAITLCFAAAIGQLIYHLAMSYKAIRLGSPVDQMRGFEVQRVAPLPEADAADSEG